MNLMFLTVGEFNVARFILTQVLVTCIVGHITRYCLDTWRSMMLERSGSVAIGRTIPLWKTRSFSTALGITGAIAVVAAAGLFSFEAWIELSTGAVDAAEFVDTPGQEFVQGTCEYLDTKLIYHPQGQSFCKARSREEMENVSVALGLRIEGQLLRDYAAKLVSAGCCKEQGAYSSRFFWRGQPSEVSVFCKAGCRDPPIAVKETVPTKRQCELVKEQGVECMIEPDEYSSIPTIKLDLNLPAQLPYDPNDTVHREMRYSLARGFHRSATGSRLKLTCMRTMWGNEKFEARCVVQLPDRSRWMGWAYEIGNGDMVRIQAHHLLITDVEESDVPIFLLAREVVANFNEVDAPAMANHIYPALEAMTRRLDLVDVDETPSAFRQVPFVAVTPWVVYLAILFCYTLTWFIAWAALRRMGIVTNRLDDSARAYARWASEKAGAGQCANGIRSTTYLVINESESGCHLTVDTKPSGVPLDGRPLLGTTLSSIPLDVEEHNDVQRGIGAV